MRKKSRPRSNGTGGATGVRPCTLDPARESRLLREDCQNVRVQDGRWRIPSSLPGASDLEPSPAAGSDGADCWGSKRERCTGELPPARREEPRAAGKASVFHGPSRYLEKRVLKCIPFSAEFNGPPEQLFVRKVPAALAGGGPPASVAPPPLAGLPHAGREDGCGAELAVR